MDVLAKKEELMRRRAALVGDLSEIEQALDAPQPTDWEDRASERQGDEVLEALGQAELIELKRIDAALVRIADGTYGMCMACEQPISDARLDAVPDAALCRFCA
ncbi:MAG: TraR/DksA C4-type zinc finger protein [Roseobacter sp.]|jgi:RNA polymerase-binding transcription factor DksA|nr:TraR/DksA C4-type zinc finger protein [Roseobacter sp.]